MPDSMVERVGQPDAAGLPILEFIRRAAADPATDIDKMDRMLQMYERAMARASEQLFNDSMSRVQAKIGPIATDSYNPQTQSRYASYEAVDKEIRPVYTAEGFALTFDTASLPGDILEVVCHILHAGGHSRTHRISVPADGKGAKGGDVMSKVHAVGSAAAYGKRYLAGLVFNLAVGKDDDGVGAGGGHDLPEDVYQAHMKALREAKDIPALAMAFTSAYKSTKDRRTKDALLQAKNDRQRELGGQR